MASCSTLPFTYYFHPVNFGHKFQPVFFKVVDCRKLHTNDWSWLWLSRFLFPIFPRPTRKYWFLLCCSGISLSLSLFFSFWNPLSPRREGIKEMFSQAKLILGAISIIRLAFPVIRCRPSDRTLDGGWVLEHTPPPLNLRKRAPSEHTKACRTAEEIVGKIG